jgi:hypothetical protein
MIAPNPDPDRRPPVQLPGEAPRPDEDDRPLPIDDPTTGDPDDDRPVSIDTPEDLEGIPDELIQPKLAAAGTRRDR